ncbi:TonB-dependent receptor [Phenylobacterium hankyongense]|nr:TonB-dependent receptor [Phenylobacterium hankyongense]
MRHIFGPLALLALASATPIRAQTSPPTTSASTAHAVDEVVVTATRPPAQTLLDRKVYTVTNDVMAASSSAAEILNNVPSVAVDVDGGITLRGDGNVTVLVDGKPSAQFSGAARGLSLLQFPASEIDRVEVLANPPAQFKAEGSGGVINIITKKTRKAGFSGSTQLTVGDKRRYVFGVDGSYNTDRLKLSGGIGLRQDAKERLTTSNRTVLDPTSNDLVQSQQNIDEHFRRLIPSVRGSVDYDLNDRQSVGASFSHRELTGARFFDQHDLSGPAMGPATSLSDRHSDGHEWSVDESEALHFDQKLWRPNETLSIALQRSVNRERERYAYQNTFAMPAAAPTFDDLHLSHDIVKTEFSADYDLPLAHEREVKFGYDFEGDQNAFDNTGDNIDPASGLPVANPLLTNHFRYRQQVNAAYGEYQTPLGAWRLQAGLRLEATHVSTLQITGDVPGGRSDVAAYPSLHLDRDVGDAGKLSASVTRRTTRPDPEALNPFVDYQDTHNLRAGNPDLRPQDTWSYQLGYSGTVISQTYSATAYYRTDRNSVTDVTTPISADVVLVTKANLPLTRSSGVEFSANGRINPKLSYGVSGDVFYSQIDAVSLGAAGLKSTTGVNLKASLDYRPTSADTAQISVSRSDKRLTPQGYVTALNLVNIGYRRQIRPDLAVTLTVSDLFDGQRYRRLVTTPQLRDDYLRHQIGRIAYVGFVYTFGAPKKAKAGFEYDQ